MNPNDNTANPSGTAGQLPPHVPPGSTPGTAAAPVAAQPGESPQDVARTILPDEPHPDATRDDGRGERPVDARTERETLKAKIDKARETLAAMFAEFEDHAGALAGDVKGEILGLERRLAKLTHFNLGTGGAVPASTIKPRANAARS